MILTLEVTAPQSAKLGGGKRQTFDADGGSIGRDEDNTWVLPDLKVSGHHAVITHRGDVFYIEDRSRNGVCLNASTNRLKAGRPHPLQSGDRILIDPYEIRVSVARGPHDAAGRSFGEGQALSCRMPPTTHRVPSTSTIRSRCVRFTRRGWSRRARILPTSHWTPSSC